MQIRKTTKFVKWIDKLSDIKARSKILVRIERLALGNPGDVKPVGEGVSDKKIIGEKMLKTETTKYDVAQHLRTQEEMAAYLEASVEEANGDALFIAKAINDIARAKGIAQVAQQAGLSQEKLYKALSDQTDTGLNKIVVNLIRSFGLQPHATTA